MVASAAAAGLGDLTTVERHLQGAMANGGGGGGGGGPEPPPPTGSILESTEAPPGAGGAGDDAVGVGADEIDARATSTAAETKGRRRNRPPTTAAPGPGRRPGDQEGAPRPVRPRQNQVKVRIAAAVAKGAAVADVAFASPTPGREADLTVEIIAGDTHARRKSLRLPAVGDSKWTKAVTVEVPAEVDRLPRCSSRSGSRAGWCRPRPSTGPVLDADAPAPAGDEGSRLGVDASTPPAAVHR